MNEGMKAKADANAPQGDGFDTVPLLTALRSPIDGHEYPTQDAETDLSFLRYTFPFLPIVSLPFEIVTAVLTINAPQDLIVPDGAVMGRFAGTADYWVSVVGAASVPTAAEVATLAAQNNAPNKSMYKPEWGFIYLGGRRSFSVVAPVTGTIVQLQCWSPRKLPTVARHADQY